MQQVFLIVGKKNDDCYVLYDDRPNFCGRACASLYTIQQLIENGYGVVGANYTKGKNIRPKDITIVNMQGQPAGRISSHDDIPDTKRSANTFIKGIKRSKDEIQKAKAIGEKRSQTIQKNKKPLDPMIEVYKLQCNGGIKRLTPQMVCFLYNLFNKTNIEDFEQLQTKEGQLVPVYYSKSADITISRQKLETDYNKVVNDLGLTVEGYVRYSFYSKEYNKSPKVLAELLLQTTKKKILYTYGLKYRHPSTLNVPITSEEALEKWKRNSMTDITEYADYIDMNQYSGNDMW